MSDATALEAGGPTAVAYGNTPLQVIEMRDTNQVAQQEITSMSRAVLAKPAVVAFFVSVPIVFTLYAKPPEDIPTFAPQRVFWNFTICAIMYVFCFMTSGRFVTAAAHRGWPLIFSLVAMILCATAILVTVGMTLLFSNPYLSTLLRVSGISIFLGVVGTIMIIEANKLQILGTVRKHFPEAENYSWKSSGSNGPQLHDVQAMVAQNQYTLRQRVDSEELVRKPLTEMIDAMPTNAGFQIHRSHWIRADRIAKVGYRNGNPKLEDVDGKELPIGRQFVPKVKAYLDVRNG